MKQRAIVSVVFAAAWLSMGCGAPRPDAQAIGATPRVSEDATQPPTRVYLAFVQALAKATAIEELVPYLALTARSNLKKLSSDGRSDRLAIAKREMPSDVTVASEAIEGEKATLKVSGTRDGKPERGTVTLVRELGLWKLANEAWEPIPR